LLWRDTLNRKLVWDSIAIPGNDKTTDTLLKLITPGFIDTLQHCFPYLQDKRCALFVYMIKDGVNKQGFASVDYYYQRSRVCMTHRLDILIRTINKLYNTYHKPKR
jgi:hypothetical protein